MGKRMPAKRAILTPKQTDRLQGIRQANAAHVAELYILGSQARPHCRQLESMIYEAADHINQARLILSEAVLLAAADRDSLPGGKAERNPPDEHPNP